MRDLQQLEQEHAEAVRALQLARDEANGDLARAIDYWRTRPYEEQVARDLIAGHVRHVQDVAACAEYMRRAGDQVVAARSAGEDLAVGEAMDDHANRPLEPGDLVVDVRYPTDAAVRIVRREHGTVVTSRLREEDGEVTESEYSVREQLLKPAGASPPALRKRQLLEQRRRAQGPQRVH